METKSVKTKYGTVIGKCENGCAAFLGVPYAKPPVGELRFMPPVEPEPWEGGRECFAFKSTSISYVKGYETPNAPKRRDQRLSHVPRKDVPDQSEDSLYLNIWTPLEAAEEKLPVMFWIHGGVFSTGSGTRPETCGANLTKNGVIVVTVNFRQGIMGYAAHRELSKRDPRGVSGNYGLLDHIAALKWVQENIEAFGGDASRVMIHGQSSGGMSTKFHLCMPKSKGLFRRAVVQSGGGINGGDPTKPIEEIYDVTEKTLERLGWTVEDMLTRDAAEVTQKIGDTAAAVLEYKELAIYQPCIDGYLFNEIPEMAIMRGELNSDEIMVSTVLGDSWMFSRKVRPLVADNPDILRSFSYSPQVAWGKYNVRKGFKPLYGFYMERSQDEFGNCPHGSEIPYIFKTLDTRDNPRIKTDFDYKISDIISAYWANFARTGNPNGEGLPEWPAYTEETPYNLHITDDKIEAEFIEDNPESDRVMEYTIAHPGMLENLEGF